MGISLFFGGSKRLPGWFRALIYCHNGDFTNFLKLVPECLARPQSARLSVGGGSNPIWTMPKCRAQHLIWVFPKRYEIGFPPGVLQPGEHCPLPPSRASHDSLLLSHCGKIASIGR